MNQVIAGKTKSLDLQLPVSYRLTVFPAKFDF
jgi:hypothetical protein